MNHTNSFSMESILPTDDKMQAMSNEELIQLLLHKSAIIRAKAIPALASRMNTEQSLKTHIFEAAQETRNQTSVFLDLLKFLGSLLFLFYNMAIKRIRSK